jgi:lipopolysaccharide export system permease protein
VRLLSRYLLRQLAAPFLFALGALTSLMLLSQVAKKFGALVGKGLPWGVIAEVFALSLPFIVAMTLPMAVLVAVLYAFSHLAADNEITAMRASGISVYQILVPVLAWGTLMSAFNFVFVDQVLPRTNAELRTLLIDINRKKPTFELREQTINEVPASQYFLRAGRIDAATGRLRDITIYDVDPPVPADGPALVPAHLLQGERHPDAERVRRAGAEQHRCGAGRPGDEHLRDAQRHPRGPRRPA